VSKPKKGQDNLVHLSELNDHDNKEITDLQDLRISQGDFVLEKNGRFRDYYQVGPVIGAGSFGEVRKCINKGTKAVRAVKIISKENLQGNQKVRFFYEMEIMKKLDHPNILRIYEVFQDVKRYYLITELCTGGELFDEIAKKSVFSEKDAAIIIEQVLEAIAYCHSKQIVHRDLKPENILIDSSYKSNIKVIDFGTSQKMNTKYKMNQAFGTSYYIAPEVLLTEYDEK
jgi:calcium-dependent protein kinase